jgi:hypothetical protein
MDQEAAKSQSTSASNSIPREPTTLYERKKDFRKRAQEMQRRKLRHNMISNMCISSDSILKDVRDHASSMCYLNYAEFIQKFREARIEEKKNK